MLSASTTSSLALLSRSWASLSCHRKEMCSVWRQFQTSRSASIASNSGSMGSDFYDETKPIIREARIISLSDIHDPANKALNEAVKDPSKLPMGASLLAIGGKVKEFDLETLKQQKPNVVFVSQSNAREALAELLWEFPTVEWIHARPTGIESLTSDVLSQCSAQMTNARGQYSSILAEYAMMACSYFAKDIPRLMQQKQDKKWQKYNVLELRGATLGIIGYGDIGKACAKLASAHGMKVIASRREPNKTKPNDLYCHAIYPTDTKSLNDIFSESDYILLATPLTPETKGLIGKEQFDHSKQDAVFINVGRGLVVDEDALIDALKDGRLKGAALDVFQSEPLSSDSELWKFDNVLISPHNMFQTANFLHEATAFFVEQNLPRFLRGYPLLNVVDKEAGY